MAVNYQQGYSVGGWPAGPPLRTPSLHELLNLSCTVKVVDIGANPIDGPSPYLPLLSNGHTKVVGFEPNPSALAKLNERKGPHETYFPYAIADGRRHVLHYCSSPGMTS